MFNEPEGCHGLDPMGYVAQYDAITAAIRRDADPQHNIKFVGLALEDVGATDYVAAFLNASNHAAGTPIDYFSFHFYSVATNRTDPASWEDMIVPDVDGILP